MNGMSVRVAKKTMEAEDIVSFELVGADGVSLLACQDAAAGARPVT
jgi:ferredoxin-NADP reductase